MGLSFKQIETIDKEVVMGYINEGKTYKEIAKILNTDRHNISYIAKNILNISNKFDSSKNKSNRTDKDILVLYNNFINSGLSLNKFCETNELDRGTFSARCKSLNLDIEQNCNRKRINQYAFDILNEESAYWIGLLLADGNIDKNCCKIELSLKDKDHIEKFKKFLNSDHKIVEKVVHSNNSKLYRISIQNKYMCERLIRLGLIPRKTYFPLIISHEIYNNELLVRNFIRGFYDGDGCIKKHDNKKSSTLYVELASYDMESLKIIEKLIDKYLGIKVSRFYNRTKDRAASSHYNSKESKLLLDWIYKNPTVYLERKYSVYKNCRPE